MRLGIKYVASGEEIYYANDKKYKVNAGEYIIGNEFTRSIVRIDHAQMVQGLCIDISSEIISLVNEFCFKNLKHKPLRMNVPDIPEPTSYGLTKFYYNDSNDAHHSVIYPLPSLSLFHFA